MYHRFIASRICHYCLNALTKKNINAKKRWSDEFHWSFLKNLVISVVSVAKPKNIVVFAFTYVLESFALFYYDFCMDLLYILCWQRWSNEARQWSVNASLLQYLSILELFIATIFFLRVKRFIAVNFYGKTLFNPSSPLLLKNSLLNTSSPLLFKVTLPTSAQNPR